MPRTTEVDWHSYAEVYDLLAENNPAYQDLLAQLERVSSDWRIGPQGELADLGAGTGNFSMVLARVFPACRVIHLDANSDMNRLTSRKADAGHLTNLHVITSDIWSAPFQPESLSAITTVHALYAFSRPVAVIAKMFEWLRPGGYLFACDAGRMGKVSDWAMFLCRELYRRQGLWRTIQFFSRSRVLTKQNRLIAQAQKDGVYWSHTHAEFRAAVEAAGFDILSAQVVYRGDSDLVVARKPIGTDGS